MYKKDVIPHPSWIQSAQADMGGCGSKRVVVTHMQRCIYGGGQMSHAFVYDHRFKRNDEENAWWRKRFNKKVKLGGEQIKLAQIIMKVGALCKKTKKVL